LDFVSDCGSTVCYCNALQRTATCSRLRSDRVSLQHTATHRRLGSDRVTRPGHDTVTVFVDLCHAVDASHGGVRFEIWNTILRNGSQESSGSKFQRSFKICGYFVIVSKNLDGLELCIHQDPGRICAGVQRTFVYMYTGLRGDYLSCLPYFLTCLFF